MRDRERRAYARRAALSLKRFDQRAFLAANISAGAKMNVDVEIETRGAEDAIAEQPFRATALQHLFEMIAQIAIFAPQIEEALAGSNS